MLDGMVKLYFRVGKLGVTLRIGFGKTGWRRGALILASKLVVVSEFVLYLEFYQ